MSDALLEANAAPSHTPQESKSQSPPALNTAVTVEKGKAPIREPVQSIDPNLL